MVTWKYKIFNSFCYSPPPREKWAKVGKNVVVLHQFRRASYAPSPSPFALKLETYLRMAEIPYEVFIKECYESTTTNTIVFPSRMILTILWICVPATCLASLSTGRKFTIRKYAWTFWAGNFKRTSFLACPPLSSRQQELIRSCAKSTCTGKFMCCN